LVKELSLEDDGKSFSRVTAINGSSLFIYGTHQIDIQVVDGNGVSKAQRESFHAADIQGEKIVLGYGWIRAHKPVCDWAANSWRWPVAEKDIEIVSPEEFYQSMRTAPAVYGVYYDRRTDDVSSPSESRVAATGAPTPLLEYLSEYADVFSDENAGVLPAHSRWDHAIDVVERREPPFSPLYNLS